MVAIKNMKSQLEDRQVGDAEYGPELVDVFQAGLVGVLLQDSARA